MPDSRALPAARREMTAAPYAPRLVAWELTRACPLNCRHCRAAAEPAASKDELTTSECKALVDNIASFATPIIILTGGEPMLRGDVYEIARYATALGLPVVMAPCGMLLNDATVRDIIGAGIRRISISIDGATAESHDALRGASGAFEMAARGAEAARRGGLDFQVNTAVSRLNAAELPAVLDLAVRSGAKTWNPFFLVPTGRGAGLADDQLDAREYERTLTWLAAEEGRADIGIRVTCAPHYHRILRQRGRPGARPGQGGCLGGKSFAFVSHTGKVQICGFLDVECGDLRREGFSFERIWKKSEVFEAVRSVDSYRGRCGYCEFRNACGGCRARAYAMTGDYLGEEPFCAYEPARAKAHPGAAAPAALDEVDKKLLSAIQLDFPAAARPFDVLAKRLCLAPEDLIARTRRLKSEGYIRRLGAVFDSRRLGYASTLVACKVPQERLENVARLVSDMPGVTHNYERDGEYNLWFTLTAASPNEIKSAIDDLRRRSGIDAFYSLPAAAVYKRQVFFDLSATDMRTPERPHRGAPPAELDERQKRLVRLLQDDLPLIEEPFARVAALADVPVETVLKQIEEWFKSGVILRLGAVVAHQRLGFTTNAMVVFRVSEAGADKAGKYLASQPQVSHCYRRATLDDWPYNLYAMVHAKSHDELQGFVAAAVQRLRPNDHKVLRSVKEYKKTSMRYFVEETEARGTGRAGSQRGPDE